jgi:hypothetical protein
VRRTQQTLPGRLPLFVNRSSRRLFHRKGTVRPPPSLSLAQPPPSTRAYIHLALFLSSYITMERRKDSGRGRLLFAICEANTVEFLTQCAHTSLGLGLARYSDGKNPMSSLTTTGEFQGHPNAIPAESCAPKHGTYERRGTPVDSSTETVSQPSSIPSKLAMGTA